ncbi:GTPase Der [Isoalcanivorax pacificus W11-5]|uniref:GTPase Der n=1 Tax=Isoalcanivorax pacificus W11-5 TaxID=391936 RepID=A0A0B4XKS3_9GAMM|nr:ribosome biogenesis GTPase Der [Isoalcanivorax pacificus]AJD47178.1 GTPase Der [Isoalcanivorax pacificus W11-5]
MKPVLALVGRPNVGKSTLFNRLTRTRDALVADMPGLTRDRKYGLGRGADRPYVVIDTGGIGEGLEGVAEPTTEQARLALAEADAVLFLVDGRAGLTVADQQLAQLMRTLNKPVHLVVNKTDGLDEDSAMAEFYALGLGEVHAIAAVHGRGVRRMLENVLAPFPLPPEVDAEEQAADSGIKVAVLGRPNVGKSTLVNRLLGEERVVVYDMAGTTRDTIEIPYERHGKRYTLLDTAGIRRRGKVFEAVEKFSVIKAMQAIDDAHVVVIVIDAREGLTEQDLHLLGYIIEAGRSVVMAVNKWDGLSVEHREQVKAELGRRLEFAPWMRVHTISALHGTGVGDLYPLIERAWASAFPKVSTNSLTQMMEAIVARHQPPIVGRNRIKLRYAHIGGSNPPRIIIHGSKADSVPAGYRRYLENRFREQLKLEGTPVRVEFKSSENPYEGKKNTLTERQIRRKKRLMKHVKR